MASCSDNGNGDESQLSEAEIIRIWSDDSERLLIVQDNGNVMDSGERYTTYDYSRDILTKNEKDILVSIETVQDGLSCVNDGVTFEVVVTNGSGQEITYYSDNKACDTSIDVSYIEYEKVESLISAN